MSVGIPNLSRLIAVDVETSGPDPFVHSLLAVALVPLAKIVDPLTVFVRHGNPVWTTVGKDYFSLYRSEWEMNSVSSCDAYERIATYLESYPTESMMFVGHNVGFDFSFLKGLAHGVGKEGYPNLSHRTIDTHSLLQVLYWRGDIPESACTSSGAFEHFLIEIPRRERHTALGDATATAKLFERVANLLTGITAATERLAV